MMRPAVRALRLLAPLRGALALSVLLGAATVGCGIGLMATSAYLISAAALHPSVAALGVAIVGVRFFGIARGIFRYLERYVSHAVTFGVLARLRVWFYAAIEPLAPARLQAQHSGDLLSRVVSDIETLQDFYGRVVAPPIVAALVGGGVWLFLGAYDGGVALAWLTCYLVAAVLVPMLAGALSRRLGRDLLRARAALTSHLVDGIQGLPELLAFGQEAAYAGRLAVLDARLVRLQTRLAWVTGLQTALGNAIMHLAMWTMLIVAIPLVRAGRLDGVYLAVLVLAALSSFEAVLPLSGAAQHLGSSLEAARRIFALADSPPAGDRPRGPGAAARSLRSGRSTPDLPLYAGRAARARRRQLHAARGRLRGDRRAERRRQVDDREPAAALLG